MNYISTKQKFPKHQHFAALVFSTVYIPGDERSRQAPGHGYPAEDKPVVEYITFDSRDEMEKWVAEQERRENYLSAKAYQIIEATPLGVIVKSTVVVV